MTLNFSRFTFSRSLWQYCRQNCVYRRDSYCEQLYHICRRNNITWVVQSLIKPWMVFAGVLSASCRPFGTLEFGESPLTNVTGYLKPFAIAHRSEFKLRLQEPSCIPPPSPFWKFSLGIWYEDFHPKCQGVTVVSFIIHVEENATNWYVMLKRYTRINEDITGTMTGPQTSFLITYT